MIFFSKFQKNLEQINNLSKKKEMKKKAAGHNIASDMCFTPYLEDIKKFIANKL